MAKRYLGAVLLGGVVTFGLLMLMRAVIANPDAALEEGVQGHIVELVHVLEDQDVLVEDRLPDPPPPPDEPPPDLPPPSVDNSVSVGIDIGAVQVQSSVDLGDAGGFSGDGEYLPIIKVQPIYPRRALARGLEGFVLLEFVVTETGSVRDPVVIEAQPPGIFDRAAINAALKFKYKPKMVDGKPVAVAGVRNNIKFELKEE